MSYRHPRQTCPVCHRSVATPAGKFARHDPPDSSGVPGFLISCTGSLRQAPPDGEQPLLFEVGAGAAGAGQLDLFGAGVDMDEAAVRLVGVRTTGHRPGRGDLTDTGGAGQP
ncbi:hypothetical protein ABZ203_30405 [Streptomyces albidoflavus]|uniref:hypothetical protein n=1 Tax=Streptomyces TaxID=1883 RepID=UPI001E60D351|nr:MULTISPECIES: hypothetical protein [Streptomyces]MCG5119412.1 hypothetical protein [Streptomyces sp. T7(2022)]UYX96343.1 hypothetical protein OIM89_22695 [Streptomyces sp. BI87]